MASRVLTPRTGWWLGRVAGFGLCAAAFTGVIGSGIAARHATLGAVQLVGIGLLFLAWALLDLRQRHDAAGGSTRPLVVILLGVVVLSGLSAQLGLQSLTMTYAGTACYVAGDGLSDALLGLVFLTATASIEVSGLLFGFGAGAAIGWPMLLVTCCIVGRIHRQSSERGDRLQALMEEMRLSRERDLRAASIEERHRLARELHDVLAHSLSALGLHIEAARSVLHDTSDVPRTLGLLEQAQSLADQGLQESREAIHALRSDSPPLPQALSGLVEARNRERPGAVALKVDGSPRPLSPEATVALIRVTSEAVINAARHACESTIEVHLEYLETSTTLRVVNAGAGAIPAAGAGSGYGLAGMGERVRLLGGTFSAGPTDRGTWTVTARLPQ